MNTSFCLVLHNTLWPVHQINHQINLILTAPYPSLVRASIPIPSSHLVPPARFHFFQSQTNITFVTAHHTRDLYSFHIWCSNAFTTFETSLHPQQYHLQVHSAILLRQGNISISVRFSNMFFLIFFKTASHIPKHSRGTPNIGFHSYSKELVYMRSCYKFVCPLFTHAFWVLVRSDSVFAPYKSSNNSTLHNICALQPHTI